MARPKRQKDDRPRELQLAGELCLAFANTAAANLDGRYTTDARAAKPAILAGYDDLVHWGWRIGLLSNVDLERLRQNAAQRPEDAAASFARALRLRSTGSSEPPLARPPTCSSQLSWTPCVNVPAPIAPDSSSLPSLRSGSGAT